MKKDFRKLLRRRKLKDPEKKEKEKGRLRERLRSRFGRVRQGLMDQEIYNSCLLLKNQAIVQKDAPVSADALIEELMNSSVLLKDVYGDMLFRLRSGMGEASFSVMEERIGTPSARAFGRILSRLDSINPAELVSSMRAFEEAFAADRVTRAVRRNYIRSMVSMVFGMSAVFAVLMDFVIVVVFLDMMTMLRDMNVF